MECRGRMDRGKVKGMAGRKGKVCCPREWGKRRASCMVHGQGKGMVPRRIGGIVGTRNGEERGGGETFETGLKGCMEGLGPR